MFLISQLDGKCSSYLTGLLGNLKFDRTCEYKFQRCRGESYFHSAVCGDNEIILARISKSLNETLKYNRRTEEYIVSNAHVTMSLSYYTECVTVPIFTMLSLLQYYIVHPFYILIW